MHSVHFHLAVNATKEKDAMHAITSQCTQGRRKAQRAPARPSRGASRPLPPGADGIWRPGSPA